MTQICSTCSQAERFNLFSIIGDGMFVDKILAADFFFLGNQNIIEKAINKRLGLRISRSIHLLQRAIRSPDTEDGWPD